MDEPQEVDVPPTDSTAPTESWQFSLRTVFIVTTLLAIYFSVAARFPLVLQISLAVFIPIGAVLLFQTIGISLAVGLTLLLERVLDWTEKIMKGNNPRQFALRTVTLLTAIVAVGLWLAIMSPHTFQFALPFLAIGMAVILIGYLVN